MKKYFLIVFYSVLFYGATGQNDRLTFPKYKEVVTVFFNHYSLDNKSDNTNIKFEKKPDGWHVAVREITADETAKKDGLIWSAKTKNFTELDFIKKKENEINRDEMNEFLSSWQSVHYDACPYFGYRGWDWDVIKDYQKFDGLQDTLLYGIGRAYTSYASNLLHDNSGLGSPVHRFALKEGKNSLSAEQLEKYRFYHNKSIEIFKKVKQLNPDFETLVGSIGLKVSNEYVTSFLELRMFQNEEEAMKELPENIYDAFFISLAKNYLNSCDKNAVLFVNGDTDTYPLLYVQAKYKFRTDVTVINISLLQTDRYINHLREKMPDADGLAFTFNADAIRNDKREVVYIQKDPTKVWDLGKAIQFLNDDRNITKSDSYDYFVITGSTFKTPINARIIQWNLGMDYFLKSNLMMLDIILNYGNKRPIYFAQTIGDGFLGLNKYLGMEGLAYKLGNISLPAESDAGHINTEQLYVKLMKEFTYRGNDSINRQDRSLAYNYATLFAWLAKKHSDKKNHAKAEEVLDKYFSLFPDKVLPYDLNAMSLIQYYYLAGKTKKANEIGKIIIGNIKSERINFPSLFASGTRKEKNEYAVNEIMKVAEMYGQAEFYKKLLKE